MAAPKVTKTIENAVDIIGPTLIMYFLLMLFHSIFTPLGSTLYQWYNADLTEKVTGELVIAELRYTSSGKIRKCKIQYIFTSNTGSFHESTMINYLDKGNPRETCSKYLLGDSVTVFSDPENPNFSVLEITALDKDIYDPFYTMFLVSLALALLMHFGLFRSSGDGSSGDGGCGGD
jgi:hypothetical protein